MRSKVWQLGLIAVGCLLATTGVVAGERVALLLGNAGYGHGDRLQAPHRDIAHLAPLLRAAGFETREARDLSYAGLVDTVAEFGKLAQGAEVALVYFAGHGFEIGGENYLLPVDLDAPLVELTRSNVREQGMPLSVLTRELQASSPRALIVMLDACRDTPTRGSGNQAWAQTDAAEGTLIAFSTAPGKRALDSMRSLDGETTEVISPFAFYLAENLGKPGLTLVEVLGATTSQVHARTRGAQVPWYSSGLVGDVVLVPPSDGGGGASVATQPRGQGPCPVDLRPEATALWTREWDEAKALVRKLDRETLALVDQRATEGDNVARVALGLAHDQGRLGEASSDKRAVQLWSAAADDGHAVAQTLLGESYGEGRGVERSLRRAEALFQQASNAGEPIATWNLMTLSDDPAAKAALMMRAFCQATRQ